MKTANDFAKFATDLRNTAASLKVSDTDPLAPSIKLIQFHLQTAASKAQQIAEHIAATAEKVEGATR